MSLQKFKVLTFDVVGTLIDFERGMIEYIRGAVPDAAARVGDEAILDAYRHVRAAPSSGWYPDDLVRVYGDMARELKLPAKAGVAEGFPDSVKQWPAFPDSAAALKRLRARYRLVAMTNARRWALAHMARTLGEPFDDMVTVDDVRLEKPDPQFFAFARGRLSATGHVLEDILHVAQSQYHDIGVARKLGYTVCWIERRKGLKGFGGTKEAPITKPDYHFATLAELADAVDAEGTR
jgi:putative hydrolase of the HAD superfamily